MKNCSKCQVEKPLDEFYKASQRPDGRQPSCKQCNANIHAAHRERNKQHYRDLAKTQRETNQQRYQEWKAQQRCATCPEDRHQCLDLHHIDPSTKDGAISDMSRSWSWEKLCVELDKCVVLCRNCHALHHAGMLNLILNH